MENNMWEAEYAPSAALLVTEQVDNEPPVYQPPNQPS